MRPIPVAFHIGPLEVHTYGIGLALTFWFGFVYFERRLRKNGYPTDWLVPVFLWIILAAVVGARAMHVLSNLSTYAEHSRRHPRRLARRPVILRRPSPGRAGRRRPSHPSAVPGVADCSRPRPSRCPCFLACWAMGRLLGPQLMVAGGGHPTHQWFGMYYADQVAAVCPCPYSQRWRTTPST